MSLLQYTLKNMIGGVSRQPSSIRLQNQCEEMTNCVPSVTDFLKRRSGTTHIAKIFDNLSDTAFVDFIVRGESEAGLLVIENGTAKVYSLAGELLGSASNNYLNTTDPSKELRLLTINDYNFILNTKITVKEQQNPNPPFIASAYSPGFIWVKQVDYGATYILKIGDNKYEYTIPKTTEANYTPNLITEFLKNQLNQLHIPHMAYENFIRIDAYVQIEVYDSMGGAYLKYFEHSTPYFNELPTTAPHGRHIKITGDPSTNHDDYYVLFLSDNGKPFGKGVWKEVCGGGLSRMPDPSTMPQALTVTDGVKFQPLKWEERKAGDTITCPSPSIIGKKINDIGFYRNRLCLLTGDTLCMSEAGEYFNFYPTTATALLDSDPIDVATGGSTVSTLKYIVPFNEGLFLYSDRTLFIVEHGEVLSTASVALTPIIRFDTSLTARPHVIDTSILYVSKAGQSSVMREYRANTDSDLAGYSGELTSHIPNYVPAGIKQIAVCQDESIVFLVTGGNSVYVYNYQLTGTGDKIQSAWGRWDFGGKVICAEAIKNTLYLVVHRPDGVFLERLDIAGLDGKFKDRAGFADGEEDYISSYVYSTQHIRFDPAASTITGGKMKLRTLSVRYIDGSAFKVIIERRGRRSEERCIDKAGNNEARLAILAGNEDVVIKIESIEGNWFKLTESRFEALFTTRSQQI